jgi:hypothetical protein
MKWGFWLFVHFCIMGAQKGAQKRPLFQSLMAAAGAFKEKISRCLCPAGLLAGENSLPGRRETSMGKVRKTLFGHHTTSGTL